MPAPTILILDDGELDDVAELLERLGEPFVRLRGGAIPERVPTPTRLLVATARRAGWAEEAVSGRSHAVRVAVVQEDSYTLRSRLRRLGFDWLVRRPVHPHALRLVLLRALFEGRDRRTRHRLPVGTPVHLRAGLRRREAVMLDLSETGCRLLCRDRLTPGRRVAVHVPREATGERGLTLSARVVRSTLHEDEGFACGVVFERLSRDARVRLLRLLQERAQGPAAMPQPRRRARRAPRAPDPGDVVRPVDTGASARAEGPDAEDTEPLALAASHERRKHRRAAYRELVRGEGDEAHLALVGRDLSVGGMRIEPHPALREGERLVLHLYGEASEEPLCVSGCVARDQGREGLAIRFDSVPPDVARRIEALVAGLPAVESLAGGEAEALGAIVSRIVEREDAEDDGVEAPGGNGTTPEDGADSEDGTDAGAAEGTWTEHAPDAATPCAATSGAPSDPDDGAGDARDETRRGS